MNSRAKQAIRPGRRQSSNVDRIRHQITVRGDGYDAVQAHRIVWVLTDSDLRWPPGQRSRETAIARFLLSRLVKDLGDLIGPVAEKCVCA